MTSSMRRLAAPLVIAGMLVVPGEVVAQGADAWPRELRGRGATLVVHQPQVEAWTGEPRRPARGGHRASSGRRRGGRGRRLGDGAHARRPRGAARRAGGCRADARRVPAGDGSRRRVPRHAARALRRLAPHHRARPARLLARGRSRRPALGDRGAQRSPGDRRQRAACGADPGGRGSGLPAGGQHRLRARHQHPRAAASSDRDGLGVGMDLPPHPRRLAVRREPRRTLAPAGGPAAGDQRGGRAVRARWPHRRAAGPRRIARVRNFRHDEPRRADRFPRRSAVRADRGHAPSPWPPTPTPI